MPASMTARLLCIEDEPSLREDIALELGDAGYAVDVAADGATGLAALQGGVYDLVLCDVQVPLRSGLELLEAAAALPGGRPPFIMLTAFSDPALHARCAALGAAGLLVKPVDYDELLAVVAAQLAAGEPT